MKNATIYEKPAPSRKIIEALIGCGMLAAEGLVHRRQRRVATPAFSVQNLRALVPLVFNKGEELKDRWMGLIQEQTVDDNAEKPKGIRLDVCHWMSRATFDVIGIAGALLLPQFPESITPLTLPAVSSLAFDYHLNAIQNEENELLRAYKDMFEIGISQAQNFRQLVSFYFPIYDRLFVKFLPILVKPDFADARSVGQGKPCNPSGSRNDQSCSKAARPRKEAENSGG